MVASFAKGHFSDGENWGDDRKYVCVRWLTYRNPKDCIVNFFFPLRHSLDLLLFAGLLCLLLLLLFSFVCFYIYVNPIPIFPNKFAYLLPKWVKTLYSVLRIPTRFVPSSVRVRVRGPCKQWQRAGRVKKRPLSLLYWVCNSTVQIGMRTNHRSFSSFFFFRSNWLAIVQLSQTTAHGQCNFVFLLFFARPHKLFSLNYYRG